MMAIQPKVAISKDCLKALSGLPKQQQKKFRDLAEKFMANPTQSGLNFERINNALDDKVRSLRIDKAYRAIVVHPPKGDVFILAYVAHHDDAYDWAMNRKFEVNPTSGVLQFYPVAEGEEVIEPANTNVQPDYQAEAPGPEGLFDGTEDEDLVLLAGVPVALLPSVRSVTSELELDALAQVIPPEAAEMLYYLAAGYTPEEALEEAALVTPKASVDTEDFIAALEHPASQQSFQIAESESELAAMLEAPLEQWRVFLHPSQRSLVRMKSNGPIRVLGGAGTGKTVALMHRARYLAREIFTGDDDRILVTTFTRNLATDLEENLRNLCGEDFKRLEITPINSWATSYLRRQGESFGILNDDWARRDLFGEAVDRAKPSLEESVAFYLEEWDTICQGQDVQTRDDYLSARRTGRGTRLSRRQRSEAWKVFQAYRELLTEHKKVEHEDVLREARLFLEKDNRGAGYRSVLADEIQDLSSNGLRLLRAIAPDAADCLFLAGDGHQRIYGHPVPLSQCGINIRGRARRLKVNYRTTHEISRRALSVVHRVSIDDLDEGIDNLKGYHSLRQGETPQIFQCKSTGEEDRAIVETLRAWLENAKPEEICIAARTKKLLTDRYIAILEREGIGHVLLDGDATQLASQRGVRVATMHRLKGLEFPSMLLVGVQDGYVPLDATKAQAADQASIEDHDLRERCLFYVATTRARDRLVITGFGDPSPFLG